MSLTNDIRKIRNPLHSSDIIYEDDGFFSDVPLSGSLSRSMLALNKYVKTNLLCDENDEYEEYDVAYFSKETSPNDSVTKCDTESIKSNDSNEKIEEVKSELVSTLVFTSKVSSEPITETVYNTERTDNCISPQLFDLLKTNAEKDEDVTGDFNFVVQNRYQYISEYSPEFKPAALNDVLSSNFVNEKDQNSTRTVTNTVVRIAYSDYRSHSEHNPENLDNSVCTTQRELQPSYSDIVTAAVKLVEHNDNTSSYKYDVTTSDLQKRSQIGKNFELPRPLSFHHDNAITKYKQPDLETDSLRNLSISDSSQTIHSDFINEHNPVNDSSKDYNETRYKQEPPLILHEYLISNSETGSEIGDPETVVRRETRYSLDKQEKRHTIHEFTEWGNRTNIYPDVYAPLPYKSPRRYVESDVNIHYRCPVRRDPLPLVPERELARHQAEHMKRLYREQRRTKYLQDHKIRHSDVDLFDGSIKELQDMQNRRHQDNFTPSQKTVVPLNRYDEPDKVTAKAIYTFNGQTPRELSFRKGEIIHVRRQIDSNWYEGEVHGKIGLFPYNYVEIQKSDTVQAHKKPTSIEGRARAKFDFIAQTNLELPLKKGEIVVLTRRIDQNWWEGRNGAKTGIFPDSYVTVLQEPTQSKPVTDATPILSTDKPVASPAAHGLLNGTDKRSMGPHSYTPQPNSPALANAPPATQPLPGYVAKPAQATLTPSDRGYGPPTGPGVDLNNAEPLYVDTNAEAVPYRAMYKYRPQNPDELELQEGDTVYVLEKCDDGWYVGSSQRTGRFGTFPGNYVERI